jgi:hypothetical protein
MRDTWYDTALICANGHVVNTAATSYPSMNMAFCDRCGAVVLSVCSTCGTALRGEFHVSGTITVSPYVPPAYCGSCGAVFPWTRQWIEAAKQLADEAGRLSRRERELLKLSVDDLVRDTPATQLAAMRFERLAEKAGYGVAVALREILVNVVSEAAGKVIWG